MFRKLIYLLAGVFCLSVSQASATDDVVRQTENTSIRMFRGQDNEILAKFNIAPDWHIYWKNPGGIGKPTIINVANANAEIINQSVPKVRVAYEFLEEYIYEDTAYILFKLNSPSATEISFDFVECNEVCIPQSLTFSDIPNAMPVEGWQQIKAEAEKTFPQKIKLTSPMHRNEILLPEYIGTDIRFIPAENNVIDIETVVTETTNDAVRLQWSEEEGVEEKLSQALILTPQQAYIADIEYQYGINMTLLYMILLAFLGGIILNAMPCVFPILSLKIFSLINQQKSDLKPWKEALGYTLGVLSSFILLTSFIVTLKSRGTAIGWGFQLQSPWFVGTMMVVFFILFLGMMEWLRFPHLNNNFIHRLSGLNTFTTGFFSVLVASPCTGPFMGAAIGYAFMSSDMEIYAIFTALALGYALPYALIEMFPQQIRKIMPKSGKWMARIKIILAIPLLITAVWLGSILHTQLNEHQSQEKAMTLLWKPYDAQEIARLNEQQANIFIDFTADWCLTCQFNKKLFLEGDDFKHFVEENNVHLFVADLTDDNAEYLRTLASYGRNSIPTYVYYHRGQYKILPVLFGLSSWLR